MYKPSIVCEVCGNPIDEPDYEIRYRHSRCHREYATLANVYAVGKASDIDRFQERVHDRYGHGVKGLRTYDAIYSKTDKLIVMTLTACNVYKLVKLLQEFSTTAIVVLEHAHGSASVMTVGDVYAKGLSLEWEVRAMGKVL